jgi:hypothetical protein
MRKLLIYILYILFVLFSFILTWPIILLGYIFDSATTFNRNDYEDSEFVYKVKRKTQKNN